MLEKIIKIKELDHCNKYSIPKKYFDSLDMEHIIYVNILDDWYIDAKFEKTPIQTLLCQTTTVIKNDSINLNNFFNFSLKFDYFCFTHKAASIDDIKMHIILLANDIRLNE